MGLKVLLDTNAVVYFCQGAAAEPPPEEGVWAISVITEIELLGKPGLDPDQESLLKEFLGQAPIVPLGEAIKDEAITLRRQYNLKTPDAIIAATARILDAELLTNDTKLLKVPGLRSKSLRIGPI